MRAAIRRLSGTLEMAQWDEEDDVVVFDPTSGETVLLNLVDWTAFSALDPREGPVPLAEWTERITKELDSADVPELGVYVEGLSQQLEDVGLCRRGTA
jgi:hypothetical protein